jgi:UDP-GlcNAc:undecaprenyl-phosphate/decaprenyl-phosphate GlcNAc-1-phosphate transferase
MNIVEILTSIKLPIIFLFLSLLFITFFWQRAFIFFRFKSYEGKQRVHLKEIPRLGGLLIFVFLIFIVFLDFEQFSLLDKLLISSLPIFMVGIKEDIFHNTSSHLRLIAMALSVIIFFSIYPTTFPKIDFPILREIISNYYVGLPFFLFASLVIINGTNLIDGMNGLMTFSTLSQLVALLFLSVLSADYEISKVIVLLIVPMLIFLFFNFPFGRVFIGDFGAYFIGFIISMIIIIFFGRNPHLLSWNAVLILLYQHWGALILDS